MRKLHELNDSCSPLVPSCFISRTETGVQCLAENLSIWRMHARRTSRQLYLSTKKLYKVKSWGENRRKVELQKEKSGRSLPEAADD